MNKIDKSLIIFGIMGLFICIPSLFICYNKYENKNKNNNKYIDIYI